MNHWIPSWGAIVGGLALLVSIVWHCLDDRERFGKLEGSIESMKGQQQEKSDG